MAVPRGLTMLKVANVRLALEQITSDAVVPTSMTAQVMEGYGVTQADVLAVCDAARDSVVSFRDGEMRAMHG